MFVSTLGIKVNFDNFLHHLHKWDNQWREITNYAKCNYVFIVKRMVEVIMIIMWHDRGVS